MDGPQTRRQSAQLNAFDAALFDEGNRILKIVVRILGAIERKDSLASLAAIRATGSTFRWHRQLGCLERFSPSYPRTVGRARSYPRTVGRGGHGQLVAAVGRFPRGGHGQLVAQTYIPL